MPDSRERAFQGLVAELATTLAAGIGARHDAAINEALARTGSFVGADRSYLMVFDAAARTSSNTHEWCAPGIEPQIELLQDIPLDAMPWFAERVRHGPIPIDDVRRDLPPEAVVERELLEQQHIRSLLIVPITSTQGATGFVGFDAVREHRSWVPMETQLLGVLATIIGSMIEREAAFRALDEQRRRVQAMLDAIPDLVFSIHADGRIRYAKPSPRDLLVPVEEMLGRPLTDFLEPPLAASMLEVLGRALNEGEVIEHQYDLEFPDQGRQWFEARFAAHAADEVTVIVRNVTAQREAQRTIEDHRERLQSLATRQASDEQALRHRIAAEVHDGLGQELAMARLLCAKATNEASPNPTLRMLADILDSAVRHAGELTREIDPPTLRSLGLAPALREAGEALSRRHGLAFHLNEDHAPPEEWSREQRAMLYWLSRELMVNVVRHANATKLDVTIAWDGDDRVRVCVQDDGEGLPKDPKPGFGLFRVRERLRLAGGDLTMSPAAPRGLRATIELPRIMEATA